MAYAPNDRNFYDADSHVMELPNFIIDYADKEFKDLIPPVNYKASLVTDEEVEEIEPFTVNINFTETVEEED